MRRRICWGMVAAVVLWTVPVCAQVNRAAQETNAAKPRVGFSGGMGVRYVNPGDIVDYVNGTPGLSERVGEFRAAVEFFGALSLPLSEDWAVKFEYTYMLGSYQTTVLFGSGEFQFTAHMPTVIGQYVLVDEGVYNIRIGAGGGYHFGNFSEDLAVLRDSYSASGAGMVIDLEANTAFGESLYGYLGGDLRWSFIGTLTNGSGVSPGGPKAGFAPSFHFFGVGAKFGFTYYF